MHSSNHSYFAFQQITIDTKTHPKNFLLIIIFFFFFRNDNQTITLPTKPNCFHATKRAKNTNQTKNQMIQLEVQIQRDSVPTDQL
mmetsp:Transcript_13095/g.17982  ORF Transcript_13095/g.17982 Transcript_13095/m.17982 type:complete len:85 (+) Transcript_13095:482-736(+)